MKDKTNKEEKPEYGIKRKIGLPALALACLCFLSACGGTGQAENAQTTDSWTEGAEADGQGTGDAQAEPVTLVYGSGDYTRINPAMDEHGEINLLLFNGLTAHNGKNEVVPGLAKSWEFDEAACTYTFHLEEGVTWHDGEPFTAKDVKFTIEAIMDQENGSENAPNYEDVEEITIVDEYTVSFRLAAPNVAFLDYMTMAVLPEHLLAGEDMQTSDFFRAPVGTGPYRLESWDMGQAIILTKNESYFRGTPHIDRVIFKIVNDDSAKIFQMEAGELDLALLPPKAAQTFAGREGYVCYDMQTSDYRGILFNFNNPYWQENRDIIPAVCYAIDRQAIIDAVLLGQGMPAYGPLQRNIYNNENVEHYDYNPRKATEILESVGCVRGEDGIYTRDGEPLSFVISVGAGDQVRLDMAQAAAQQIREIGIDCTVEIPMRVDWNSQMAYLIGWGSPFDADDHTYKVFGTGKGANYSGYSNEAVDRYLTQARESDDPQVRADAYARFQEELAKDPAYAFICYIDANYVANASIHGITPDTVMGHHGVGIFWNIAEWTK
ncbi:MAG: ABC transporter substrate-binding protein [Lachnospiraceae bacterium]|nr:ABC transporter substrate-binding protein [Lachnospiraceae bacterium]